MIEQQKLLRVFKLIRLLKQRPGTTIKQLAQALETTNRSIYRYLKFLESVGYEVDSDGKPPRFTEEETQMLRQALTSLPADSPLVGSIRQKVFLASTLIPLADGLIVQHLAEVLRDTTIRLEKIIRKIFVSTNLTCERCVSA